MGQSPRVQCDVLSEDEQQVLVRGIRDAVRTGKSPSRGNDKRMKHPKRIYTIYVLSDIDQKRYRFGSIPGVRAFLRYRAHRYVSPHRADGFNAVFYLDGITLEQAGYINQGGKCYEQT
jgi:hypothetical protein